MRGVQGLRKPGEIYNPGVSEQTREMHHQNERKRKRDRDLS